VDRILSLLNGAGATVDKAKASRVDVCLDILVPKELWNINLVNQRVTRAYEYASHGRKENFSGFTVGKGDILARLYNKDLEIRLKSKKTWMYDIWQLPQVPEEYRAIRIEFQIRREALVELGIDTIWQFANYPRNLWSYCTQCWLKFQDHPELHHTQQTTLPFWSTVQNGFLGSQPAHPLIRAKMVNVKRVQLAQQFLGQFTSLIAIDSEELEPQVSLEDKTPLLKESAVLIGMDDQKLSERVRRKLAKYVHEIQKFKDAEARRKTLNLPQKSTHVKECSKQILERPRHD